MKLETAAQREEKIRELAQNISKHCAAAYDHMTEGQRIEMFTRLDDLEKAMIEYRNHEQVWDSKLIDKVERYEGQWRKNDKMPWVNGVLVKAKEISIFDSVMDKAREILVMCGTGL